MPPTDVSDLEDSARHPWGAWNNLKVELQRSAAMLPIPPRSEFAHRILEPNAIGLLAADRFQVLACISKRPVLPALDISVLDGVLMDVVQSRVKVTIRFHRRFDCAVPDLAAKLQVFAIPNIRSPSMELAQRLNEPKDGICMEKHVIVVCQNCPRPDRCRVTLAHVDQFAFGVGVLGEPPDAPGLRRSVGVGEKHRQRSGRRGHQTVGEPADETIRGEVAGRACRPAGGTPGPRRHPGVERPLDRRLTPWQNPEVYPILRGRKSHPRRLPEFRIDLFALSPRPRGPQSFQ